MTADRQIRLTLDKLACEHGQRQARVLSDRYGANIPRALRDAVRRQLVVARCNAATVLDLVEEPFDQVAGAVEVWLKRIGSLRLHRGGMLAQAPLSAARVLIQSAS